MQEVIIVLMGGFVQGWWKKEVCRRFRGSRRSGEAQASMFHIKIDMEARLGGLYAINI